jgi:hypothetical protein
VWSVGVITCIVASYMSAAHERYVATGKTILINLSYRGLVLQNQGV